MCGREKRQMVAPSEALDLARTAVCVQSISPRWDLCAPAFAAFLWSALSCHAFFAALQGVRPHFS